MSSISPFLSRLSVSRGGNTSVLPLHNNTSRHPPLLNQYGEYDLDALSPQPDEAFISSEFHDPNFPSPHSAKTTSNRKPTGALNRRPSNSSSGGSTRRFASFHNERVLFNGPPPPIAVSKVLYRDEEQQYGSSKYDDNENHDTGIAASWLPSTAQRAISSVIWDSSEPQPSAGERPIVYDRNSVWRSLAKREKAIVHDVQQFLLVQEESLSGGGGDGETGQRSPSISEASSTTPTRTANTPSSARNPHRSVSFLEPVTRSGPGGEIIPVRQPRQKKLGIGAARKGISRSLAQLADLKAEEETSLLAALSTRKQALGQLRKLVTRHESISEELKALETDEQEPLAKELEDLEGEHKGVCSEIRELEERLAALKTRRRHLEGRIDDVRNRREAGLSGYKNALREVDGSVKSFLTRPPVKPLDLEALAENTKGESPPSSPGGVEFMHMRPERRTMDMARDWWEAEVSILEKRKATVDTERAALEEGGHVWQAVVGLVLEFEADLRRQMMSASTTDLKGKGRKTEGTQMLKVQYEKLATVITALEQRMAIVEGKGWNLLIAAIGAELEAFREAADMSRTMLTAAGVTVDDDLPSPARTTTREDSGTTGTDASYHTVNGGNVNLPEQLLDLPNNHEDEERDESDNDVPHDLLAAATEDYDEHDEREEERPKDRDTQSSVSQTSRIAPFDREDSENEVPPEFLVEHDDARE